MPAFQGPRRPIDNKLPIAENGPRIALPTYTKAFFPLLFLFSSRSMQSFNFREEQRARFFWRRNNEVLNWLILTCIAPK